MGKAFFISCSSTVKIEGRPVCRKTDMMIMNTINTISMSGMMQEDVDDVEEVDEETREIEIELKDANGDPIADERYIVLNAGKTFEGNLDSSGKAKVSGIKGSHYKLKFPDQDFFNESE